MFLFLFQMLLFKVCIAVVSPFFYVFAHYYGATVLSHYFCLFLNTNFPTLASSLHAHFPTLSLRHKTCAASSQWHGLFQMAVIITCLADDWLLITIKQVDFVDENTSWIFIHREQKCEEAYHDLHPHVQIDVTPSRLVFLAIYPKRTKLYFVFWCLKKGLREKCLRDTSHVLHIIQVLKKIHKGSQSVTPSRRGIAHLLFY